ncbi:adenosylcobinamide-GDP ribazoletransferase [Arhodomonas sp. AD133]|uniref:adenosylcobinamide-GDP ribazoletransferase n=1 Tax=Arhodomonas sp. AD133 TaxID=3415009 RepID=UPI003EC13960
MKALITALAFLTRLPVPAVAPDAHTVGRSLLWYPLVGAGLGAIAALVGWGAGGLLGAALAVTALVLLSGALHLDGLADTADAWVGGLGDAERTLAIMKDPSAGPVGVAAVVVVLLLELAAAETVLRQTVPTALVVAAMLGRAAAPALFLTTPYVRPGGLGDAMARHRPGAAVYAVLLATAAASVLLLGLTGLAALVAAAVTVAVARSLFLRRIGGITGDTVGATMVATQTLSLVAAALTLR